jgi:hypothetical protein
MFKKIALFLIMLSGFSLRLYGINFGLPFTYHADEPVVVNHAMAYGLGGLNPHFFNIPPLVSYIIFALYGAYFIIGKSVSLFTSPESFALGFLRDPTAFYIIGRFFVGVLIGTATIFAIYVFAKKLFSQRTGLASALFAAVVFISVQNSHYIYVDTMMVFFIVLTCIAAIDITDSKNTKSYIMSGIYAGIATAVKYNAALVFIVILMAHFAGSVKRSAAKLCVSLLAMCATYFILNPYSILDFTGFMSGIMDQAGAEHALGVLYHMRYSLLQGAGIVLVILGIAGMVYYGVKSPRLHLAFISFPVVFYLVLCFFSQPHERYALPLVPFLVIYASAMICEKMKNVFMASLFAALIVLPNLARAAYSDYLFTQDDTRTIACEWIERNIEEGSRVAIEHLFFCPRLNQTKEQISEKLSYTLGKDAAKNKRINLAMKLAEENRPAYNIFYLKDTSSMNTGPLFERPQLGFSVQELKKNGIEYVVLHVDSLERMKNDLYQELLKEAIIVKEFSPYKNKDKQFSDDVIMQTGGPFLGRELFSRERNGYIIKIFKLGRS